MNRPIRLALALLSSALVALAGCASKPPPASSLPSTSSPGTGVLQTKGVDVGTAGDPAGSATSAAGATSTAGAAAAPVVPAARGPQESAQVMPTPDTEGAGTLLMYTVITGSQPYNASSPRGAPSTPDRWTAAGEESRGKVLEAQIEEELRKRQEALEALDSTDPSGPTIESLITGESLAERANPRMAPKAPKDQDLPWTLFEKEQITIVAGSWGNSQSMEVTRGSLDADKDGKAEQIRYFDPKSRELLRLEQDTNFDGQLDTRQVYQKGELVARERDTNEDGNADVWERYAAGVMTERTIDRNRDGVPDAFYVYDGETLVEERHDANDDGKVDRRILYENFYRVYAEEDRTHDGAMDTWTRYGVSHGEEVVVRVERASKGSGAPDVVETYDTSSGKSVIAKREEDRDGDGEPDVTSYYENGKLVQRVIADPELAPL